MLLQRSLCNNIIITAFMTAFMTCGCSTRNFYRNKKFVKPPLVPGYVHMTRPENPDAGVEPAETGEVLATESTLYVASQTRGIEALDRSDFSKKWNFMPKNGVSNKLLLHDEGLYFGAEDGSFYSVDAEFGRLNWKYETKAPVFGRAGVAGNRVYIHASDDVVYALDKANGKWIWHYKRTSTGLSTIRGNSTPTLVDGKLLVGFSDGYLVALNASDGNILWEVRLNHSSKFLDVDASVLLDGNNIYIPSYDGSLFCLNKTNGNTIWKVDLGGSRAVQLDDKTLYLSSSNGHVYALNKESGRILWKFELDRGVPTDILIHNNYIAFGSSQEYFYVIHKGDGSLAWRYAIGLRSGFMGTPHQAGSNVYALSNFGNVYSFQWKSNYHEKYHRFQ